MKNKLLALGLVTLIAGAVSAQPNRIGQAGGTELLLSSSTVPVASGVNGMNFGSSSGIEANVINPAGLAAGAGTELLFAHTRLWMGSGMSATNIGFAQKLGESGSTIGISLNSFSFGDFIRTTTTFPDGTMGKFNPSFMNFGVTYAKKFTEHIYVGATLRVLSESMPDANAIGTCFDAGVQYRALENDALKLGITLKNIGPTMRYQGQGLEYRVKINPANPYDNASAVNTDKIELPSILSMGGSYDFHLNDKNTLTLLGGFISNAYFYNQLGGGLEYKYGQYVALRGGFLYEKGITSESTRYNAYTGLSAGASFQVPLKNKKSDNESLMGVDIAYRTSGIWSGTLSFGARINL